LERPDFFSSSGMGLSMKKIREGVLKIGEPETIMIFYVGRITDGHILNMRDAHGREWIGVIILTADVLVACVYGKASVKKLQNNAKLIADSRKAVFTSDN